MITCLGKWGDYIRPTDTGVVRPWLAAAAWFEDKNEVTGECPFSLSHSPMIPLSYTAIAFNPLFKFEQLGLLHPYAWASGLFLIVAVIHNYIKSRKYVGLSILKIYSDTYRFHRMGYPPSFSERVAHLRYSVRE